MSKKSAIAQAKSLRASGKTAKVFHHAGIYTQPGRGIVAYSYYLVQQGV